MTPLRRYYRGHNLVTMHDVGGADRHYHFDHQGTTQCLTDSNGSVTDRFAASAWGVQTKRTGSSINRQWYIGNWGYFRQVGHPLDYIRARYLSFIQGRWISRDPSGLFFDGSNPYAYVKNRPAANVDPSGRFVVDGSCRDLWGLVGCRNQRTLVVDAANRICSGSGGMGSWSMAQWQAIFACAQSRGGIPPPRQTAAQLKNCMTAHCATSAEAPVSVKISCHDALDVKCWNACAYVLPHIPPGPREIVVCYSDAMTAPNFCIPCTFEWNMDECDLSYGISCPEKSDHNGTLMILHEMVHNCNTVIPIAGRPWTPDLAERWASAVSCCIAALHRI
jgi:RHS repeat-associated protein